KDARFKEVLMEIERQTGYALTTAQEEKSSDARLSARFRDATYWEVLEAAGKRHSAPVVLTLANGKETFYVRRARFSVTHGAFRAALTRLDIGQSLNLEDDEAPALPAVTIHVRIQSEPRLPLVGLGAARVEAAYDDRGASMIPLPPPPAKEGEDIVLPLAPGDLQDVGDSSATLSLVRPSRLSRSIKLLRGSIPVTVLVGRQQRTLLHVLKKGAKFILGEDACTLSSVRRLPGLVLEAKLRIQRKAKAVPDGDDDEALEGVVRDLEFHDATGRKCQHEPSDIAGDTITLRVAPAGEGKGRTAPASLALNKPLTRTTLIPFAFRNVPLP
ncbi:MAG: hypothetical protein K2W96_03575, partial [Gemmataceae bacterium]|nr:hypothetical protein [Gemmataceae bacterium]